MQQIRRPHNVLELRVQPRARMILDADVRRALQALIQSRDSRSDELELVAMLDFHDASTEEARNPIGKILMLVAALPRIRACDSTAE